MKSIKTALIIPILFMANMAFSSDLTQYSINEHSYKVGECTAYFETAPVSPYEQGWCTIKCGSKYYDFYFGYEHPVVSIFNMDFTNITDPLRFVVSNYDYKLYYLDPSGLTMDGDQSTEVND